jgi:hypothetical protein
MQAAHPRCLCFFISRRLNMTKTAFLLSLTFTAVASVPAHAQQRVFVSGQGFDTNPCTVTQPCRTFQHAHDIAANNGEIDVIDPAGYGPLTIAKGISIQAHGFGGITQATSGGFAITISVTTLDPVMLNGLLLDGGGAGEAGIVINSGRSVQILDSVIRHFQFGVLDQTGASNLLIEDTMASDNSGPGVQVIPGGGATIKATLNRITANNNQTGVDIFGGVITIANSVMSNNGIGLQSNGGTTFLAKNVISGNGTVGVNVSGTVNSYGDNYIKDNGTPVANGTLTPVTMQ